MMLTNIVKTKYAIVGAVQGLLLYVFYGLTPVHPWGAAIEYALYFISGFVSLALLLLFRQKLTKLQIRQVIIIGLLMGGVSIWLFFQAYRQGSYGNYSTGVLLAWSWLAVLLTYILLPFIQAHSLFRLRTADYSALYRHSWDNFFVVFLAGMFMFIYWLMIILCSNLFKMLGIHAVEDFLISPLFLFPTMSIMFAIGVAIGHEHEKIISTLRFIALSVCRYLLPLSVLISLVFAATLFFTGLDAMWSTRFSTHALLWLIVVNLVFLNGIYQDGTHSVRYPVLLKSMANITLFALLAFALIAVYSVYLRIAQYGLTPNRIYIVVISVFAVLYTASYAWSAYRSFRSKLTGHWLDEIKIPNVTLAYLVALLIVVLHSPFLDPYSISARSQLSRLLDPATDVANFDYGVLKYKLGNPGRRMLVELENDKLVVADERRKIIEKRLAILDQSTSYYDWKQRLSTRKQVVKKVRIASFDKNRPVPEGLTKTFENNYCRYQECKVLLTDLTHDGVEDALVVQPNNWTLSRIYVLQQDRNWKYVANLQHSGINLYKIISDGNYSVVELSYKTLRVEGKELGITPQWKK
ncbi:MAG: DUF4153 domain-containing protein [Thioalkalispiraceae bacterium]